MQVYSAFINASVSVTRQLKTKQKKPQSLESVTFQSNYFESQIESCRQTNSIQQKFKSHLLLFFSVRFTCITELTLLNFTNHLWNPHKAHFPHQIQVTMNLSRACVMLIDLYLISLIDTFYQKRRDLLMHQRRCIVWNGFYENLSWITDC